MQRLLIAAFCFFVLSGCYFIHRDIQNDINNGLQPVALRQSFNTQPQNLKSLNQCLVDPEINIIGLNPDKKEKIVVIQQPRGTFYVDYDEMNEQIVNYLKDAYRQCRVAPAGTSSKKITITIKDLSGSIGFSSRADLKILVGIPEKNLTIPFMMYYYQIDVINAIVYSVHDISWQIINDPTIQDYVLCR